AVNGTPVQTQTVATPQIAANRPSVTPAQTQTVATPQIAANGTPVTPAQAETIATPQTAANETSVTPAQVQTVTPPQTVESETPSTVAQAQTMVKATVALTPIETEKTPVTVVAQISQNETAQVQKDNSEPKTSTATDDATALQLTTAIPLQTAAQSVSIKQKVSDNASATTIESEHKTPENQDASTAQVIPNAVVSPLVTAQVVPVHVEAEKVAIEKSTETTTTTSEKPTLTSAKTLLMDAVANRNTGGDTANNGNNNGGNTPSNPALQGDALLNQTTDNKQSATDLKSFASLLAAEKPDAISASATAPTSDKSAPQTITAAVNKLVQDTKVDVPAMTKPISHPEWSQDMGERIVWMNNRGISSAEIKMNPQNMGPITVRIDMNQDQATIAFTAQNSEVRTALEASIPKLREMLSSQQVTLAEVNVSQQSSSNDSGRSQQQTAQMMADASANGQGSNRQTNQELDAQGNPVANASNNADGTTVDEFANGQVIDTNGTNGLLSIYA
ncbi:MAG: flagellar hook-length control protein FliK, partial [Methylococcales bacterium]|nr:flagellar hook-length control protein FliK [Methylococcales bacterium]